MRLRIFIAIMFSGLLLQSCFIADQLLVEEPEETTTINIQAVAEKNIADKIKSQLKNEIYKPYGFSQLSIIKPVEILNLEKMEAQLKKTPQDTALSSRIKKEKELIRKMGIERSAKLEHFFALTTDSSGINVMEIEYTLNDTLGVKATSPQIILTVPSDYQLMIDYYFNEYTIIIAQSYAEGKKMSRTFYKFFKDQLETYTTVEEKSNFLKHTLDICKMVKLKGNFDQDFIVQSLLKSYIKNERTDITDYKPIVFSELLETRNNADNSVVGYYFFHKFIGNYENQKDTNVVLVEFSPFYQVDQVFQLEGSFESYTAKTE